MGKGDKRSFKGKVFKGSYGKTRPRHPAPKAATTGQGNQATQAGAQQQKRK